MNYSVLLAFIIYIALMIGTGLFFYSKATTVNAYFLGERKIGPYITSISTQAADMSGWLLMGLPGAIYIGGASAAWVVVGVVIGTYVNWVVIAKRLRQYTRVAGNGVTLPSYFRYRFQDEKGWLSIISSAFILVFFLFYTAAGFVAGAKLLGTVFDMNYYNSLACVGIIIVAYIFAGGFLVISWANCFRGILIVFSIAVVAVGVVMNLGGFSEFVRAANDVSPTMFNMFETIDGEAVSVIEIITLLAWGLGYFGQPHILAQFMGIESPSKIKISRRVAMVWTVVTMISVVVVGIAGRVYLKTPLSETTAELVYAEMVSTMFPGFLGGILLCAILAAIMSTTDSQLFVSASTFTYDVYRVFNKKATNEDVLWMGRWAVIILVAMGCSIASDPDRSVLALVEYAWGGFGATFGPVIIFSLFYRRMTAKGALAGIISGGLTVTVWEIASKIFPNVEILSLYEIIPGFLISAILIVVVSRCDEKPTLEVLQKFDAYKYCDI